MSSDAGDPRALREGRRRILEGYNRASLEVAYKTTLKMPVKAIVSGTSRGVMIDAILRVEFPTRPIE
jgi:hypothetical protein